MKVCDLQGATLDYWVARAEGIEHPPTLRKMEPGFTMVAYESEDDEGPITRFRAFEPSSNPVDGWPIVDRDHTFLDPPHDAHYNGGPNAGWKRVNCWSATVSARTRTWSKGSDDPANMVGGRVGRGSGETSLIAAMRAKVARHYGDEVPDEVPTE